MMMNQAPGPARRAARLEPGTMIYKSNAMSQYGINITMIKFNLQVTVDSESTQSRKLELQVQVDSEFWHWQLSDRDLDRPRLPATAGH
jgi:hypothetical protein